SGLPDRGRNRDEGACPSSSGSAGRKSAGTGGSGGELSRGMTDGGGLAGVRFGSGGKGSLRGAGSRGGRAGATASRKSATGAVPHPAATTTSMARLRRIAGPYREPGANA